MSNKNLILILLFLIFLAISIRCVNITLPWLGDVDSSGANMGNEARNAIRYGLIETKFGACNNSGPVIDGNYTYYINHPLSIIILLTSISYRTFGIHEWSTRLVPIIFSIGTLVMFYIIVQILWDKKTGVIAVILYGLNPLTAFYDRLVWYDPLVMFFILVMIYFYLHWIKEGGKILFIMMTVFQALGLLSGWPAYYIGPLLLGHCFFYERKKTGWMFIPCFVNIVFFALHLLHIQLLQPGTAFSDLFNVFMIRTGDQEFTVSWLEYIKHIFHWFIEYFTLSLCFFSLIWLVFFLKTLKKKGLKDNIFIITLFLWGCIHIVLFKQGTYVHEGKYWFYYFTPFLALSGALGLLSLQDAVLLKITYKNFGKHFFWSLTGIAILGCVFLTYYRSVYAVINWYSMFSFFHIICIVLTVGLGLFTWKISKDLLQKYSRHVHPISLLLLLIFFMQSLLMVYTLQQKRGYKFNYDIANAINENSRFEDAFITSLSAMRLYIPYYADRYIVLNIRTMDDYLNILKKENRPFKYYITTNRELMKTEFLKTNEINESIDKMLDGYGITSRPCELDIYMSQHFMSEIVGPWIIYDLTSSKISF